MLIINNTPEAHYFPFILKPLLYVNKIVITSRQPHCFSWSNRSMISFHFYMSTRLCSVRWHISCHSLLALMGLERHDLLVLKGCSSDSVLDYQPLLPVCTILLSQRMLKEKSICPLPTTRANFNAFTLFSGSSLQVDMG